MSEAEHHVETIAARDLPADLNRGLSGETVSVDVKDPAGEPRFRKFWGIGAHMNTSVEEAVARVRALRDERD